MQILEEKEGDLLIVSLRGHLDTYAAPSFEERLVAAVADGTRGLILDCAGLEYVNSAGLKSFLVAAKQLEGVGGKFVVCALPNAIAAVFATIGFDQILNVAPTRQDAIRLLEDEARPV